MVWYNSPYLRNFLSKLAVLRISYCSTQFPLPAWLNRDPNLSSVSEDYLWACLSSQWGLTEVLTWMCTAPCRELGSWTKWNGKATLSNAGIQVSASWLLVRSFFPFLIFGGVPPAASHITVLPLPWGAPPLRPRAEVNHSPLRLLLAGICLLWEEKWLRF